MRRFIPFIILGLLTAGTVVGLIVGLSGSHHGATGSGTTTSTTSGLSVGTTSTTAAPGATTTTGTTPVTSTNNGVEACAYVTAAEAKTLLAQITNKPPLAKTPFCSYGGIVTVPPSTRPPTLSVTAVTDPKAIASAENLLTNNVAAVCGSNSSASCIAVLKENNHVTVDGTAVIWRQAITTADGVVGSAYAVKNGKVVVITVSGLPEAAKIALKAMGDAIPRL
jgi:hypothetical protein